MNDLDTRIRVKLAEFENDMEYGNESALDMLLRVTYNVLDQHKAEPFGTYIGDEPPLFCLECSHGYGEQSWPCPTVQDIADSLGIDLR